MNSTKLTSQELRSGFSLAAVYVFRMLGLFMVIPVIAVAAVEYPDYSPLWVGLAIGGYGLTQAILQIPMGILSDRWGRKPVIFIGLTFFAIGSLIAGLAENMTMLTLGRILQGAGAIAGAVMALAADVTRESQRTKIMAIIGVSIGFSFYIALLVGPIIASGFGLSGIFFLTAALALLCFPLVKFGVPNAQNNHASGDSLPRANLLKPLLKNKYLWRLNFLVLVLHLLITSFFVQVPVILEATGIELADHYQVYGIILVVSVILLVGFIRMSDKFPVGNMFNLAILFMAVGFVLLTQVPSYYLVLAAGISFFVGFNFLEAKMPAMVSSIAPAGQKGSAMGIYASYQFFGAFLGGILSGLVNTYYEPKVSLIACLVLIFAASLVSRGLAKVEKVKRITLAQVGEYNEYNIQQQLDILMALDGVKDITTDTDANVFYLKVDAKQFDVKAAKSAIEHLG
ncbi:MFS transporter [Glaciecola sp. 1036]|uniref:MFS transporter n=1 Tax=Alteromonadaceae TaxID=72275 RepID=UPI003D058778